jgi:hypothetical protein
MYQLLSRLKTSEKPQTLALVESKQTPEPDAKTLQPPSLPYNHIATPVKNQHQAKDKTQVQRYHREENWGWNGADGPRCQNRCLDSSSLQGLVVLGFKQRNEIPLTMATQKWY